MITRTEDLVHTTDDEGFEFEFRLTPEGKLTIQGLTIDAAKRLRGEDRYQHR